MGERKLALSHLVSEYTEPVKDPLWKNIPLSAGLLRLAGIPAFQKLNGIKQLGPTYLVYPGATHTRLSHSLGVFHIARRMLLHLAEAAEADRRPQGIFCLEGVKAFLCAALLHDLGHYPFAHSLKELDVAGHESLTAQRILREDVSRLIREDIGTDPGLVAAIVDSGAAYAGGESLAFYRRLLSGVLDPDKLDYLNRDAYFCGVPYGIQDVDFALAEIRALPEGLAVTRKGLSAVESILFSKYLMYRSVYWHKTVRIATAMIKKAALLALSAGVLRPAELYGLDDQEFFALAEKKSFSPLGLLARVARRQLFKQVASVPLAAESATAVRLADLQKRLIVEGELAREAGRALGRKVEPQSIIIDIPEPISFEIELPVLDLPEERASRFADSGSVFTEQTVGGFTRCLRRVSLIAENDEELIAVLSSMGGGKLLEQG